MQGESQKGSQIKLSILIPTIASRRDMLLSLVDKLLDQAEAMGVESQVEIIPLEGPGSIGSKRNALLDAAQGEYVAFFDDDDEPGAQYIRHIFEGIAMDKDCISLRGVITFDGDNPAIFEHSIKYCAYKETKNDVKYERYPNHLNAIRASIAKQFRFPEVSFGEDTDWATQLFKSGKIKSEHYVDDVIYHYKFVQNK